MRIKNDRETTMTDILQSSIQPSNNIDLSTYEGLVQLFKGQNKWLTTNLLKGHVHVLHQKLEIKLNTWLAVLPEPFPQHDSKKFRNWLDQGCTDKTNSVTPSEYTFINYYLIQIYQLTRLPHHSIALFF